MALEYRRRDHRTATVREVLRSPGSPLDPAIRAVMEVRFGRDFGLVRLHTDALAAASARALGARAYAAGSHVVFADGAYAPRTREGLWLLAHELAHVVQQSGSDGTPIGVGDANDPLEREADQAAKLVTAGDRVPPGFVFGAAPAGVVQRHPGPPCAGSPVPTDAGAALIANDRLTSAYLNRLGENTPARVEENEVFRGIYWDYNFQVPTGRRVNRLFAEELLNEVRVGPETDRPDVIDFGNRVAYFFVPVDGDLPGMVRAITRFHYVAHRLAPRHAETAWNSRNAGWFPPHTLEFDGDKLGRLACTEGTNHNPPRGLILYGIRTSRRQRRRQPAARYDLVAVDRAAVDLKPTFRAELPRAIRFYDPDSPNYVIIVPRDLAYQLYKRATTKLWETMGVKPSYNFPGGQLVKNFRGQLHFFSLVVSAVGVVVIIAVGVTVLAAPGAAVGATTGATATTGAAAGTTATTGAAAGATATTGAAAGATATTGAAAGATAAGAAAGVEIVVPAAVAGGAAAASGAAAIAPAAFLAMQAAPAVKSMLAAGGVLIVIATATDAHAGRPTLPGAGRLRNLGEGPTITNVSAIRAVPIADFQPAGSMQAAFSAGPPMSFAHTPESAKGKFGLGTEVLFDGLPYVIMGQVSVQ